GVPPPTWQDPAVRDAGDDPEALWAAHAAGRRALREEIAARGGVPPGDDVMVIGFARGARGYKRNDLVLRDAARLARLLDGGRVAFVFSGKAHPDDAHGKGIV